MVVLPVGNVPPSSPPLCASKGVGQAQDRAGSRLLGSGTWRPLVKHSDCCCKAFISGVFVPQLFEMFNKAL